MICQAQMKFDAGLCDIICTCSTLLSTKSVTISQDTNLAKAPYFVSSPCYTDLTHDTRLFTFARHNL